jgi:hypothetical protein
MSIFNYGWMRMSVHQNGTQMVIKDWAINMDKEQAILTGRSMRWRDEADISQRLIVYSYGKRIYINGNTVTLILK